MSSGVNEGEGRRGYREAAERCVATTTARPDPEGGPAGPQGFEHATTSHAGAGRAPGRPSISHASATVARHRDMTIRPHG
jgi:hypothetical protein